MSLNSSEAKITVGKILELAYSTNKGVTAKILAGKDNIRLTVDEKGDATLSGAAGSLRFSGKPALEQLGVKVKRVTVFFENAEDMKIGYTATFQLAVVSVSVKGKFDLEELILSCSGLLCRAARAMKGRTHTLYEAELKSVMDR